MLNVRTPDEVIGLIQSRFGALSAVPERVPLRQALGRVLRGDVVSSEYVPGFDRSTVDGYAVRSSDTFGCSDGIPALLTLGSEVKMGAPAETPIGPGECAAVSTGGGLPDGADSVVMLEYTENYGDGTIGVLSPSAPGNNVIFMGDDVTPGVTLLPAGTVLAPHDIGALAAVGISSVEVAAKPTVGIISTGDELVGIDCVPNRGKVRDVNSALLEAAATAAGGDVRQYGIVRDDWEALNTATLRAASECDITLISGGSSAGTRDLTARVIGENGELLLHGIAMKPGKPTILGIVFGRPVFGLPGHPVAAYFTALLYVKPLISVLMGSAAKRLTLPAKLAETLPSNHGRAEYIAVTLEYGPGGVEARPVRTKSGLITSLAGTAGYICIPRDSEGLPRGAEVAVTPW